MAQSGGANGRTEAVLTCPGEIDDPNFPQQCSELQKRLSRLLGYDDVNVVKCEPWNSVKITFDLPAEAAEKLSELAKAGDNNALREMGILSLQIQGGQIISMTMMSDEELKRKQSSSSSSTNSSISPTKIKLESDSNPSSSSLLVNLLQNKDQLDQNNECRPPQQKRRKPSETSSSPTRTGAIPINPNEKSSNLVDSVDYIRSHNKSASSGSSASLMPPPLPPILTSMVTTSSSTSPVFAGASGTIPALTTERGSNRPLLINPNTGVLESGPSESSSEGEAEHSETTTVSSPRTSNSSDKALKLKLKLPVTPPQTVKNPMVSPGSSASSEHSNSTSEAGGPKLPKLILSMRDKTVKQKFSKHSLDTAAIAKAAAENQKNLNHSDDSDSENGEVVNTNNSSESKLKKMFIPKSNQSKRTLDTSDHHRFSVKTENPGGGSSKSSSHNTTRVNHVISNCNMSASENKKADCGSSKSSSSSSSSSTSSNENKGGTKKHNNLVNNWTKSLTSNINSDNSKHSRLAKGAFDLHKNNEHSEDDEEEDIDELDEQKNRPFSGLRKGTKKEVPPTVVQVNHVKLSHPNATNLKEFTRSRDVIKNVINVPHTSSPTSTSSPPTSGTTSVDSKFETSAFLNGPNGGSNSKPPRDLESSSLGLPQSVEAMDSGAHQQGEDSGIESMDTLSEKSPNQGENPYPNEDRLERELASVGGGRKASPSSSLSSPSSTESTTVHATTNVITTSVTNIATLSSKGSVVVTSVASTSASSDHENDTNHTLSNKITTSAAVLSVNGDSSAKVLCKTIPTAASEVIMAADRKSPDQTSIMSAEQLRTASPVMVNGHNSSNGGGVTVRPAHIVPPGAKMVPVKLVSVSAEGNLRLVRLSPVKTTTSTPTVGVTGVTAAAPPSTVIIKSTSPSLSNVTGATPPIMVSSAITTGTGPLQSLPLVRSSSQPLNATNLLQNNKETTSNNTKESSAVPPSLNLGPSLSILPVYDPPPAGQVSGNMTMKDVVESINKKNSMMESLKNVERYQHTNAATTSAASVEVTKSTSIEQPLNIEVNRTTVAPSTTVTKTITRQPLVKRSPVQQSDFVPGGGSLLKPLLATSTPPTTTTSTASSQSKDETPSTAATTHMSTSAVTVTSVTSNSTLTNHIDDEIGKGGKRRRRDTDSSTKSDKSDISLISIESSHSVTSGSSTAATKKAKVTENKKGTTTTPAKARNVKGATVVASKAKSDEEEPKVISNAKKPIIRTESARGKIKGKVSPTTSTTTSVINSIVTTSTATVSSNTVSEPEVARRSGRQQTPTPTTIPATRPPSARQATPTRQIVPSGASAKANATTPTTTNKKANNTQVARKAEQPEVAKPKRNSTSPQGGPVNSGTSIASTAVTNDKEASKKRMNTRSTKASTPSADENFETKRRRLKLDS